MKRGMNWYCRGWGIGMISGVLSITLTMQGCTGDDADDSEDAAPMAAAQDAGAYGTLDSIVSAYNTIVAERIPNWSALAALLYAENDRQSVIVDEIKAMGRMTELLNLCKSKFGSMPSNESLDAITFRNLVNVSASPATLGARMDRRAEATYRNDARKRSETLHLVEVGGSWWISAMSFDPLVGEHGDPMALALLLKEGESAGMIADEYLPKVRNGEIASLKQLEDQIKTFRTTMRGKVSARITELESRLGL